MCEVMRENGMGGGGAYSFWTPYKVVRVQLKFKYSLREKMHLTSIESTIGSNLQKMKEIQVSQVSLD